MIPEIKWPDGKDFAFTIFDDPDLNKVESIASTYSLLHDLGYRTTKAIWPIRGNGIPKFGGATCEDEEYLKWVLRLKEQGFEIALHNATYHTVPREQTAHGLATFHRLFGHYPYTMSNHSGCDENLYWGRDRLSAGVHRRIYDLLTMIENKGKTVSEGHIEASPLFWGDICKAKIKYVRNFVVGDINTLKACPTMPYHDPDRPYVNYWFAASEGGGAESFNAVLREESQDRLAREGGACIMYAHLARGFFENGKINTRFKVLMERLSKMNGWFVPVYTLLDFILRERGDHVITTMERKRIERKWLWHKVRVTHGRS